MESGTMPIAVEAQQPGSPLANKPAAGPMPIDRARLEREYLERVPDPDDPERMLKFGAYGYGESPLLGSFTQAHVLAITEAICDFRHRVRGTDGPLYVGKDTHALSTPTRHTAPRVLAANAVETVIQQDDGVTPAPVTSHAILAYNRDRQNDLADGIVLRAHHVDFVQPTYMIDRVARKLGRRMYEVPASFQRFAPGPLDGALCFGAEASAGATFLRRDGVLRTTHKDRFIMNPFAAEITARTGKDPATHYRELTAEFASLCYTRIELPAMAEQKELLERLSRSIVRQSHLAGQPILAKLTRVPGSDDPIGGVKVVAANGWFAVRPSSSGDHYRIYAESLWDEAHPELILSDATEILKNALNSTEPR
jgi:phosphoglucomutase